MIPISFKFTLILDLREVALPLNLRKNYLAIVIQLYRVHKIEVKRNLKVNQKNCGNFYNKQACEKWYCRKC